MEVHLVYITARNPYAFRSGSVARIVGVRFVQPDIKKEWRVCYQLEWEDGVIDYVPISEVGRDLNYSIICMGKCD